MVCKRSIYDIISRIKDELHPYGDDCVMHIAPSYMPCLFVDNIPEIYYIGLNSLILGPLITKLHLL